MRILIIDSNNPRRVTLKRVLEQNFFTVETEIDLKRGSYAARVHDYDLVIMEHELSADAFCRELRRLKRMYPILVLHAEDNSAERTLCLNAGADHCMHGPVSGTELVACVRALLRRCQTITPNSIDVGDLHIDWHLQRVEVKGKEVALSRKEYAVLEFLALRRGAVVPKETIIEHVWDSSADVFSRALETQIYCLRMKLDKGRKQLIQTIVGRGYRLG